jgi:pyridoxine 4-dehydrogenase
MNRYFTAYPEDADKVVLCVKSGVKQMGTFSMDCSAPALLGFVDNTLRILDGKKKIDIFGFARVDPAVPVEESIKALATLKKAGKIGGIQLSEVRADTIRRAAAVEKIDMVEAEISLWATDIFKNGVAEVCRELGIILVAHSPLAAGMLTGKIKSLDDMSPSNYHRRFPRWQPENFTKNMLLVEELERFARAKECPMSQLALTWIKVQSRKPGMPYIVPIAGTKSEARLQDNLQEINLTEEDLEALNAVLEKYPVVGARYPLGGAKLAEY